MGPISGLFGRDKEDMELHDFSEQIRRILADEQLQIDMLHPALKEKIEFRPVYDKDPNGTGPFGFSETNPIPVNGPIGQLAYLSKLETAKGERILFHRIGAVNTIIDVFEAVTFSGGEWFILFTDFYHPRKSRLTPEGFRFTAVGQFSGFHKLCNDFPYDFVEMKQSESLSMAYIAIDKVVEPIQNKAFKRPLAHKAKLDLVKSRLTSVPIQ